MNAPKPTRRTISIAIEADDETCGNGCPFLVQNGAALLYCHLTPRNICVGDRLSKRRPRRIAVCKAAESLARAAAESMNEEGGKQ